MAARTLALPTNSRPQAPLRYFKASVFAHFPLSDFSCFSLRQKSANKGLVLSCPCGALTINGQESTSMFTDPGVMLFQLFRELGFREKEIEALLDTNAALRSTPFESIRCRIESLQSAGVSGNALSRLIAKRPDVLTAQEIEALLSFILDDDNIKLKGKIKPSQIVNLLDATDPGLLVGFGRKVRLLHQFGITEEKLVHVVNTVSLTKALSLKSYEEMERTLALFQRFGGVELIIRRPVILNYDLETQLMPIITFLLDLSGDDEESVAIVLRKWPFILAYSMDYLKDHVGVLNSYAGLSYREIFRVILVHPSLFSASTERKLCPRINFLKECGLSSHEIFRFLIKAPLFLSLSFEENLANKLVCLVKIGYQSQTKELAMAMGAVSRCSCKNLQEVIGVYLNYGLTCEDILDMSKKHPQVLQYKHTSLEEKLDYLIEEMGREVREVLSFPAFLGYKLDGRIKQRYEERRKIVGKGMSLNKLLNVSAARFSSKSKKKLSVRTSLDQNDIEGK